MVEKRTVVFMTLATLVWASVATSFTAYYYLVQMRYQQRFNEKQQVLNELTETYDASVNKQNRLSGEYGALLGEYQWFTGENYSSLMGNYGRLLSSLSGNYTAVLNEFPELNTTHRNLLNESQTLSLRSQVTREEFGSLLDSFYKLFTALTIKEIGSTIGKANTIQVRFCINYTKITGKAAVEWHNISFSSSATLFDLTKEIANVKYSYYASMEPGHIIVTSINNYTSWWIWYYWDETVGDWSWGPVGCDAWILSNNGTYKWDVSS
jgi:hypothetical protein